jgi:hypothetical protein
VNSTLLDYHLFCCGSLKSHEVHASSGMLCDEYIHIWHEETAGIVSRPSSLYWVALPILLSWLPIQEGRAFHIHTSVKQSQWSCCMFKSPGMWCPYGLSAWCNIPKVLNMYQTFCHKREMPVHNIQDCWIVLNDTYIGSLSVILFSVENVHCFGSWLCLWYRVKPKVIKPTALGMLHWAKQHPFTSCMVIIIFFSVESIVSTRWKLF